MKIIPYVTATKIDNQNSIKIGNEEILNTLGDSEQISIQLQELFESLRDNITPIIESDSKLTVEVTGEVSIKLSGGVNYLFFNIGGEAGETNTVKVTLETTLKSKSSV